MSRVQLSLNVRDLDAAVAFYSRLVGAGLPVDPQPGTMCCYARQHKVWARDPDGLAWEYYTVLEHIERP